MWQIIKITFTVQFQIKARSVLYNINVKIVNITTLIISKFILYNVFINKIKHNKTH